MNDFQYLTPCARNTNRTCPDVNQATPAQNGLTMKCGSFGSVTIPAGTEAGATFPLANLNVNGDGYRKPCVRMEFQSNILNTAATVTLNFQVFKQCKYQFAPVPVGPIWTYSRAPSAEEEANAFAFAVCDCDHCDCGCCNYSVVATVAGTAATAGTTTLNNSMLMATIVETSDC